MDDPVARSTADLRVWLVDASGGRALKLRDEVIGSASKSRVEVLVLRGDMVFGSDHLRSALYHAKKAVQEGRNASNSLAMETLLYASGERQLGTAIKKMSVDEGCKEIVIAQLTAGRLDTQDAWQPMEAVRSGVADSLLMRFGIEERELRTVSTGMRMDLVLEKVASVDVMKK